MTKRNWLERTWNRIQGLTEQDFENCKKLSVLTGLDWKPFRLPTEHQETTIYAAKVGHEDIARAVAAKLIELLAPEEYLRQPVPQYGSTFIGALDRVTVLADKLVKLEVTESTNLAEVKAAVAAAIDESREPALKKDGKLLLNNIPG